MTTVSGTDVPVTVLHRLALGIELRDHVTGRAPLGRSSIEAELPDQTQGATPGLTPDLDPLETWGGGRFKLRYDLTDPFPNRARTIEFRVTDPSAYHVPRRCRQLVRPLQRVLDGDDPPAPGPGPGPITPDRRTVELWLFPGPGYPLSSGTTALRGQVLRAGQPLPWPRVGLSLSAPPATELGWTHGDQHGQFLIALTAVRPLSRLNGPFTVNVQAAPPSPAAPVPPNRLAEADPLRSLEIVALPDLVDPPHPATPTTAESRGQYLPTGAQTFTVQLAGTIPVGRIRTETIAVS